MRHALNFSLADRYDFHAEPFCLIDFGLHARSDFSAPTHHSSSQKESIRTHPDACLPFSRVGVV